MGCRGDALASPPVLGHRPGVARIRRHLVAARVTGVKPVLAPPPLDPLLARRETTPSPFAPLAWAAIGALEFGRDGRDQRPPLRVRPWLALRHPPRFQARSPRILPFKAAHRSPPELSPKHVNPGGLHQASFVKDAAAFITISSARLSRPPSACSRGSFLSSGVILRLPTPLGVPFAAAFPP